VARYCAESFQPVTVFADPLEGCQNADHNNCWPFFAQDPGISLRPVTESEGYGFDTLLLSWSHRYAYSPRQMQTVELAVRASRRVVLLYDAQFGRWMQMLMQQWRT
jgi:hypothetical protein